MVDPLHIDVNGMFGMATVHDAVAEALGGLQVGDAPLSTHGVVASPVTSALGGVLGARGDVLRSTSASGQQISSLLQGAADAYRSGDEHGADALRRAAEPMGGSASVGSAAAATPSAPATGAPDPLAAAGQVGQVVGQVVQSVTQPLQGLAQSLGQLPGQLLGGLGGLGGIGGLNDGGIGDAAGLSAPLEHSAPAGGHSAGTDQAGGPGSHHGSSHAHELRRDHGDDQDGEHDRADKHPDADTEDDDASAAQELDAAAPAARRPAATRPQD